MNLGHQYRRKVDSWLRNYSDGGFKKATKAANQHKYEQAAHIEAPKRSIASLT